MHSLMPVINEKFEEIYIWSDNQASQVIAEFRQSSLSESFYRQTGTPIHAMSPFAKLLHFKSAGGFDGKTKWYGLKELVMLLFTGAPWIDRSTASATGLYSLEEKIGVKRFFTIWTFPLNSLRQSVTRPIGFLLLRPLPLAMD